MARTLETLKAEADIRDIHARYCRAADRVDMDLLRTCFHDDAVLEFSFWTGGPEDFIAMAETMLAGFIATTHMIGNQLIRVDGDRAASETYTLATHRIAADDKGPERDYATSVRYIDTVECRDGEWRIASRLCVLDWARTDPVADYCDGDKTGAARRDRSDPSYQVM